MIRTISGRTHALLIRDPYLKWGLPKGHLERGEKAPEAAAREVSEETGLMDVVLGPELATIDWYFRAQDRIVHKFCAFFLMASEVGDPVPSAEEGITECIWVPIEEAEERIGYDNAREIIKVARRVLEENPAVLASEGGS